MLQLYRLTNTDVTQLQKEANELEKQIKRLEAILSSETKLSHVIRTELEEIKGRFADQRRSQIEEQIEEIKINLEVMVAAEDVMVTVTRDGYIKRTSLRSYTASNKDEVGKKEEDVLLHQLQSNTTETLLLFTNKGNYLYMPVHQLPDIKWKDTGQHIANLIPIEKDERMVAVHQVKDFKEPNKYFLTVTRQGMVKMSALAEYEAQRVSKPIIAAKVKQEDAVVDVLLIEGQKDLFLVTEKGYALWFDLAEINPTGQRTAGVKGIQLKDDSLISATAFTHVEAKKQELFVATQRGAVKKVLVNEFTKMTRARKGVLLIKTLKNNPHRLIGVRLLEQQEKLQLILDNGVAMAIDTESIRRYERESNGTFVIDQHSTEQVVYLLEQFE